MKEMMEPENLGRWVQARRKRRGLRTQPELAAAMTAIGPELVSDGYVSNLETGRVRIPGQPFLRQLAGALGVSEIEILRVSGVLSPAGEDPEFVNPFPAEDERWPIVEALKDNDPFVVQACLAVVEHAQRVGPGVARQSSVSGVRVGSTS